MSRRLVNLTLDTLEDLPRPCRQCVYWELDPVSAERACAVRRSGPGEGGLGLADPARVGLAAASWRTSTACRPAS